uniref:Uncharacterized protein n=1 Tax=Populus davidiana TaxID=266767 RepID=A0A6M2ENZ0_9ROSI
MQMKKLLTWSAGIDGDDGKALAGRHCLFSSAPSSAFLCSCAPVPAVCFLLPADFEMTKETTMEMPVYCGCRLLSLFFVFAGIKRWQGQSILVCVYASLFLPCSTCYFFLYFCAPLYFFLCPPPCVFVLLSVPCVREDGDQRWPSGFLMAFVSVFCSVSRFCFWLDSSCSRLGFCISFCAVYFLSLGFAGFLLPFCWLVRAFL